MYHKNVCAIIIIYKDIIVYTVYKQPIQKKI